MLGLRTWVHGWLLTFLSYSFVPSTVRKVFADFAVQYVTDDGIAKLYM